VAAAAAEAHAAADAEVRFEGSDDMRNGGDGAIAGGGMWDSLMAIMSGGPDWPHDDIVYDENLKHLVIAAGDAYAGRERNEASGVRYAVAANTAPLRPPFSAPKGPSDAFKAPWGPHLTPRYSQVRGNMGGCPPTAPLVRRTSGDACPPRPPPLRGLRRTWAVIKLLCRRTRRHEAAINYCAATATFSPGLLNYCTWKRSCQ
jgi:hypothetical protein